MLLLFNHLTELDWVTFYISSLSRMWGNKKGSTRFTLYTRGNKLFKFLPNEQYSSSEKICFVYRVLTWTTPLSSPYPKSHTFVPSCHVEHSFSSWPNFQGVLIPPHLSSAPPNFYWSVHSKLGWKRRDARNQGFMTHFWSRETPMISLGKEIFPAHFVIHDQFRSLKILSQASVFSKLSKQ